MVCMFRTWIPLAPVAAVMGLASTSLLAQSLSGLEPTRAEVLALARKARNAIDDGNYQAGRAYLKAAIALHRTECDVIPSLSHGKTVTEEDLEYGRLQLERLANDRPVVMKYIGRPEFKPVEQWLVRAFAGAFGKKRIEWRPARRSVGTASVTFMQPVVDDPLVGARISIAAVEKRGPKGQYEVVLGFQPAFESLVHELCEASYTASAYSTLTAQILKGMVTREEAIERCTEFWLVATQRKRDVLADVILPFAAEADVPIKWFYWDIDDSSWCQSAAELLADKDRRARFESTYGPFYDNTVATAKAHH